jgi:hypothetical protein
MIFRMNELSRCSDKLINDRYSWIVLVSSCSLFIICKRSIRFRLDDYRNQDTIRKFSFELGNLEGEIKSYPCDSGKIILLDKQATVIHDRRLENSNFISKNDCYFGYIRMPNVRFDIQVKLSKRIIPLVR